MEPRPRLWRLPYLTSISAQLVIIVLHVQGSRVVILDLDVSTLTYTRSVVVNRRLDPKSKGERLVKYSIRLDHV